MFRSRLDMLSRFCLPGALLDIGAGKGEFVAEANKRGWQAVGVEPSGRFAAFARERHAADVRVGLLGPNLGLPAASFDAVTLNHVLEHVDAPESLLRVAAGFLRPNGVLFIEVPNSDSYLLAAADAYFRLKGLRWSSRLSPLHPPFHRFGFTPRSLKFLLDRAEYHVLTLETYSGRDRGCSDATGGLAPRLRDAASAAFSVLGRRELLVAMARPAP